MSEWMDCEICEGGPNPAQRRYYCSDAHWTAARIDLGIESLVLWDRTLRKIGRTPECIEAILAEAVEDEA